MNEDAFMEMKEYLIKHYAGIEVLHSYIDENGSIFDCVPIGQQASAKESRQKVAKAPDLPTIESKTSAKYERKTNPIQAPLRQDRKDRFGNAMFCPPGTIPKRRITLEELARFKTLRNFFQKSPLGSSPPPNALTKSDNIPPAVESHKYAHAYQIVDNVGGHSYLNIQDPVINRNDEQVFSLSQHWYVAGSNPFLQTAEIGWQVYPEKYNSTLPVLFIYWTADSYNATGCYNLDCAAFVQTNSSWHLGGTLVSGQQSEIECLPLESHIVTSLLSIVAYPSNT